MPDPSSTTHPAVESTITLTRGAQTSLELAREDFSTRSGAMSVELVAFEAAGAIFDADSFEYASALRNQVLDLEKDIQEFFAPHKRDAQKVHKNAVAAEKAQLSVVVEAKLSLKRRLEHWNHQEVERLRLEHEEATARALDGARQVRDARVDGLVAAGRPEDAALEATEPLDVILPDAPSVQAPAGSSFIETYVAVLEDIVSVPERFVIHTFDQRGADLWLKETMGKQPIPGCRIETRRTVRRTR